MQVGDKVLRILGTIVLLGLAVGITEGAVDYVVGGALYHSSVLGLFVFSAAMVLYWVFVLWLFVKLWSPK